MKKLNFILLFLMLTAGVFSLTSCGEKEKQLPLPDFRTMLIEAGSFKGDKYDVADPFNLRTDVVISVSPGNTSKEVIFKEGDRSIRVEIDSAWSNAARLKIPAQTVNGASVVGAPLFDNTPDKSHGYYEIKDAQKNPLNTVTFRVSINSRKWTYQLKKQ